MGSAAVQRGPENELLTPTGGPAGAFLERFLSSRGAGPHHVTFLVPDIDDALAKIRALGIEPIGVNLANPAWREAFLHPHRAFGIVVQVAQHAGAPPASRPAGAVAPHDSQRAGLLAKRLGLTVELAS